MEYDAQKEMNNPPLFTKFFFVRLVMLVLICLDYFYIIPDTTQWRNLFLWSSMLILASNHLVFRFSQLVQEKYYIITFGIECLIATLFGYIQPGYGYPYSIIYGIIIVSILLTAKSESEIKKLVLGIIMIWFALVLYTYFKVKVLPSVDLLTNIGFVVFCYFTGFLIRHYQRAQAQIRSLYQELGESHQALQDTHEQLRSYSQQVEELTATREQNRIAREIHDTVGHTMTALLVQLQVAKKLIDRDPAKSKETVEVSEDLVRSALQDIRTSVRALKDQNQELGTFLERMQNLLEDFSTLSEMKTNLRIDGDISRVSITLQSAIYRIVQESLTNAKRHGQATKADVYIQKQDYELQLYIHDNGTGTSIVTPSFGLLSMRERVQEFGGSVQFASEPGKGFEIRVRFPLKQQEWSYGG